MNSLSDLKNMISQDLDNFIGSYLSHPDYLRKYSDACSYYLTHKGKLLRPLCTLTIASFNIHSSSLIKARPLAVAIELTHIASLIHDDLPSMDDDSIRRNKPCLHKVMGEAGGILAGDALFVIPFQILSRECSPEILPQALKILTSGTLGMIQGQWLDLYPEISPIYTLSRLKTGSLFGAAFALGGLIYHPDDETYQDNCFKLGEIYGVIYQYLDDCQDKEPPEIPNIPKDLMESFQEASSFLSDLELVTLKKTLNL